MALIPNPQLLYNPLVMTSPIDLDAFIARWAASGAAERANFQTFATQKSKDVSHINIVTFVSCHAFDLLAKWYLKGNTMNHFSTYKKRCS